MAAPKAFSLFKKSSFEETFPAVKTMGRRTDFFLQCETYDMMIPVSVNAEKRLDIFEEAVLKLIAYKALAKGEIADILCLSKDLVSFILIRLQEMGLLERDGYTVSGDGKKYLRTDSDVEKNVEYIQAKLFVLKKTGEILPYIHVGGFETEYVSTYSPDSMTIDCGSAGTPFEIKGDCLRHKRTEEDTNGTDWKKNGIKPDRIRNAVRLFNRITARNLRFEKIIIDRQYAIERSSTSEDINFHMQAVVQEGNIDEIMISDGFVAHVDLVGRYIRQEYPYFIEKVKKRASTKLFAEEMEGGERKQGGSRKAESGKYRELREVWKKTRENYEILQSHYGSEKAGDAADFSQDQYKEDRAVQKVMLTNCYSALEWCFYCHCAANPVSERLLGVLDVQTALQNANTVEQFAEKLGVRNPGEYHFLFSGVDGGKIRKLYGRPDYIPNMNLCLPLALLEAAGNEESRMRELLRESPGLLYQIGKLKKLRDALQHQAKSEEIMFSYDREVFAMAGKCIRIMLPEFAPDNGAEEADSVRPQDSYSQDRLNAEVSLSKALGAVYYNNVLSEELRNEWIRISPDKTAARLPDPAEYVDILYRILQDTLYEEIVELRKNSALSKEEIVRTLEKRMGRALPGTLANVKEIHIASILKNQRSTLGAHALVWLYAAGVRQTDELMRTGYPDIVGKIVDFRKHGNNVSLQVGVSELNELRDAVIEMCKKIGGE